MKKFLVKTIALSLKANKIAKHGEVVAETQLSSPASELIEAGYIEPYKEEIISEDVSEAEKEEIVVEKPKAKPSKVGKPKED